MLTKQEAALRFQVMLLERGAQLDTSIEYWKTTTLEHLLNGYDRLDN